MRLSRHYKAHGDPRTKCARIIACSPKLRDFLCARTVPSLTVCTLSSLQTRTVPKQCTPPIDRHDAPRHQPHDTRENQHTNNRNSRFPVNRDSHMCPCRLCAVPTEMLSLTTPPAGPRSPTCPSQTRRRSVTVVRPLVFEVTRSARRNPPTGPGSHQQRGQNRRTRQAQEPRRTPRSRPGRRRAWAERVHPAVATDMYDNHT